MRVAATTALVVLVLVGVLFGAAYAVGSAGDAGEAPPPSMPPATVPEIRDLGAVKPLPKLAAIPPEPSEAASGVVESPPAAPPTGPGTTPAVPPPAEPVTPAPRSEPEPEPEPEPTVTTPAPVPPDPRGRGKDPD